MQRTGNILLLETPFLSAPLIHTELAHRVTVENDVIHIIHAVVNARFMNCLAGPHYSAPHDKDS